MQRLYFALVISWLAMTGTLSAATTFLDFNNPSPGTLNDVNGIGTGFTDRLPGSGSAIPANDPNLSLDTLNSHLLIGSTHSDINGGGNLPGMEAPALKLSSIGSGDFVVRARFLDLHVDQLSDQIEVFVGASVSNVVRGGAVEGIPLGGYTAGFNYSFNGADGPPTGGAIAAFQPGEDGEFELGRIGGVWHFSWQNLSNPVNSGTVGNVLLPGLDAENDLWVGVLNHDARNTTPQLATLDYFQVLTGPSVPEPSSIVMLGLGAAGLFLIARRQGA